MRTTEPATSRVRPFLPAITPTTLFFLLMRNEASTAFRLIFVASAVRVAVTLAVSAWTLYEPYGPVPTKSHEAAVTPGTVHESVPWLRTIGATSAFPAVAAWLACAALTAGATGLRSAEMWIGCWGGASTEPR